MPKITCEIPIRTVSELNCNEHWTKKAKRHRQQKFFVREALKHVIKQVTLPCKVTVTRLAERTLDSHDNLPSSVKYPIDAICELLRPDLAPGRADDDKGIIIAYAQSKQAKMAIRIEIEYGGS
jgi:hypothetical protein